MPMTNKRLHVFAAIDGERQYQDEKWGGPVHDSQNSIADFVLFLEHHLARAREAVTTLDGRSEKGTLLMLSHVRKVAALAVACMEVHGAPQRGGHERQWLTCPECGGPCTQRGTEKAGSGLDFDAPRRSYEKAWEIKPESKDKSAAVSLPEDLESLRERLTRLETRFEKHVHRFHDGHLHLRHSDGRLPCVTSGVVCE